MHFLGGPALSLIIAMTILLASRGFSHISAPSAKAPME
jgi:hypothetical protein